MVELRLKLFFPDILDEINKKLDDWSKEKGWISKPIIFPSEWIDPFVSIHPSIYPISQAKGRAAS